MDITNTRALERDLDHVAQRTKTWTGVLHEFYKAFMPQLESALQEPYEKPGQSCEAGPFIAGKGLANSYAGFKCPVVPAEIQASKDLLAFWKRRKKDLLNDNPRGLPKAGLELRDDLQLVLRGITAGLTGECSAVALPPHHLDEYLVDPPDEMRDLICRHTKKGGPGLANWGERAMGYLRSL